MTHHRRQSAGPPPLTPPHRKSGLPDLRTILRNPGKPGFRGEGNTSTLWHGCVPTSSKRALTRALPPPGPLLLAQGVAGLPDECRDAHLEHERGGIELPVVVGMRSGRLLRRRERVTEPGTVDVP